MFHIENGRTNFYQWDTGQRLIVGHADVSEVHFAHPVAAEALRREVYEEDGQRFVDVPDVVLQQPRALMVYGCCSECVRVEVIFRVVAREKPTDYIYTEEERREYDALRAQVYAMCPPFELTGDVVTCYPVEGHPLEVVSLITPTQGGSGTPSPDNVRPISGHEAAVLTVSDAEYNVGFGQTVYGGTYDWERGVLTVTHRRLVLDGSEDEKWFKWRSDDIGVFRAGGITDAAREPEYTSKQTVFAADRLVIGTHGQLYAGNIDFSVGGMKDAQTLAFHGNASITTAEQWRAWLAENPVTVVYRLATPYEVQLTGTVITAAAGENVMMSSTGATQVRGKLNPAQVIADLTARVAALEAAAVTE